MNTSIGRLNKARIRISLNDKQIHTISGKHGLLDTINDLSKDESLKVDVSDVLEKIEHVGSARSIKQLKFIKKDRIDLLKYSSNTLFHSYPIYNAIYEIANNSQRVPNNSARLGTFYNYMNHASTARTKLERDFILHVLSEAIYLHHSSTSMHSIDTMKLSVMIAKELRLGEQILPDIKVAAMLHDLGKIAISKDILDKKEAFNENDIFRIKLHVDFCIDILNSISWISDTIKQMVKYHHYLNGYPEGIDPKHPPLGARVIAVADSYDAMTSGRIYTTKKTPYQAMFELRSMNYDQKVVTAFEAVLKRLRLLT